MYCFGNSERRALKRLRKIQAVLSEKRAMVNKLKCPTYKGARVNDMEEFAFNFARLTDGTMSPEEFAARCTNIRWDTDEMIAYLNKLGEYLVIFTDYENKSIAILKEIEKLEREERQLKAMLGIH